MWRPHARAAVAASAKGVTEGRVARSDARGLKPVSALWTRDAAVAATGGASPRDWAASASRSTRARSRPGDLFVALTGGAGRARLRRRGAGARARRRRWCRGGPEGVADGRAAAGRARRARGAAGARARRRGRASRAGWSRSRARSARPGARRCCAWRSGAQGSVHAAEKSFNNHWGVPLTLARMPAGPRLRRPRDRHERARRDRAAGAAGAAARGADHHRRGGASGGVPRRRAASRARRRRSSRGSSPAARRCSTATRRPIRSCSRPPGAPGRGRCASAGPGGRSSGWARSRSREAAPASQARAHGTPFLFRLGAPGRHLAMNALGVLAAVEALGGDIARAALALGQWRAPEGRGARWTVLLGPGGLDGAITLIDESYNANPAAMAAALEVFAGERPRTASAGWRAAGAIAFLGDMLELGPRERELHAGLAGVPALASGDHRALRRPADAGALRRAAGRRSAASGSTTPRRWRRARGGWSTPATSPWSRARSARGSARWSRRSRPWARRARRKLPEG